MCVRSHTKAVQDIIAEVCVYDGCRYWCNTLNPGSMLEFVTPAFTQGIQPHIEQLLGAAAETAIIAALFMTMFVVGYLGGYAPPDSKYINNRGLYSWGFCLGSACFVINLLTSMVFRFCAATMAREADMLVFISKTRYWHPFNTSVFALGIVGGVIGCLGAADQLITGGDMCIAEATGGSMSFITWFLEWTFDDYQVGAGVTHTEGEPIRNPWAVKADELGIAKPTSITKTQATWVPGGAASLVDWMSSTDKKAFSAYKEFMTDYFELEGYDCIGANRNHFFYFMITLVLLPGDRVRIQNVLRAK